MGKGNHQPTVIWELAGEWQESGMGNVPMSEWENNFGDEC